MSYEEKSERRLTFLRRRTSLIVCKGLLGDMLALTCLMGESISTSKRWMLSSQGLVRFKSDRLSRF